MSWFGGGGAFSGETQSSPSSTSAPSLELVVERLTNSQGLDDLIESLDAFSALTLSEEQEASAAAAVVPVLCELLQSEFRDEAVLQRVLAQLSKLCCRSPGATIFLSQKSNFEILLECLSHQSTWVQIHCIGLLSRMLKCERVALEEMLLSCNLGLRRLMDIIARGHEVHVKCRNDMLALLQSLTQSNDRIKEFISFSQGFEMIFEILGQEKDNVTGGASSALSLDCLRLLKNILSDNRVTRKMFAQSPVVSSLPALLEIEKQSSTGDSSHVQKEVLIRCHLISELSLELLSGNSEELGLGKRRVEYLQNQAQRGDNKANVGNESSTAKQEELIRRDVQELRQLQEAVCSPELISKLLRAAVVSMKAITAKLGVEIEKDSGDATSTSNLCEKLSVSSLNAIAALVCGLQVNQDSLSTVEIVIPWGSKRMVTSVGSLAQILHICLEAERASPLIRSAGLNLLDAYFCLNDTGRISFIGHAIAPPPADLSSSRGLDLPKSRPAGRIVVQQVVESLNTIAMLASTTDGTAISHSAEDISTLDFAASIKVEVAKLHVSCSILESIIFDDVTCKELLLKVEIHGATDSSGALGPASYFLDSVFRILNKLNAPLNGKSEKFAEEVDDANCRILRMVAIWSWECYWVADKIFASPAILSALSSVFNNSQKSSNSLEETRRELYAALLVASCIWTCSDAGSGGNDNSKPSNSKPSDPQLSSAVTSFVDNVVGVQQIQDLVVRVTHDIALVTSNKSQNELYTMLSRKKMIEFSRAALNNMRRTLLSRYTSNQTWVSDSTSNQLDSADEAALRKKNASLASIVAAQETELSRLRALAAEASESAKLVDSNSINENSRLKARVEDLEAELTAAVEKLKHMQGVDTSMNVASLSARNVLPTNTLSDDKSDLYVLLAHMQLENKVLLKHLSKHGSEAIAAAREEAVVLLERAARGL